jgi:hypothetical protein
MGMLVKERAPSLPSSAQWRRYTIHLALLKPSKKRVRRRLTVCSLGKEKVASDVLVLGGRTSPNLLYKLAHTRGALSAWLCASGWTRFPPKSACGRAPDSSGRSSELCGPYRESQKIDRLKAKSANESFGVGRHVSIGDVRAGSVKRGQVLLVGHHRPGNLRGSWSPLNQRCAKKLYISYL